jgi:DNA-binding PadR family transcriptional regulator
MFTEPRSFLPLTPLVFQVLLALVDGDQHGYAIIRGVEHETAGAIRLRSGTLYALLQRLIERRLIEEVDAPSAENDDARRRYYRLAELGRSVLKAEALRLRALVGEAERKRVIPRTSRS